MLVTMSLQLEVEQVLVMVVMLLLVKDHLLVLEVLELVVVVKGMMKEQNTQEQVVEEK
jgi:hypothetical protein